MDFHLFPYFKKRFQLGHVLIKKRLPYVSLFFINDVGSKRQIFRTLLLSSVLLSLVGLNQSVFAADSLSKPVQFHLDEDESADVRTDVRESTLGSEMKPTAFSVKSKSVWLIDKKGRGTWESEVETKVTKDRLGFEFNFELEKEESKKVEYQLDALASAQLSQDAYVKMGTIYEFDGNYDIHNQRTNAVIGLELTSKSKIKVEHYLYSNFDDYSMVSLDLQRNFKLNNQVTLKPYIEADFILKDSSYYAEQTGLNQLQIGMEGRYALTNHIVPFIDIAYDYNKGKAKTLNQNAENSSKDWSADIGIEIKF